MKNRKEGFLAELYERRGGIKYGIGRVESAFKDIFRRQIPVYHVAGTNGKGTVVYAITQMLRNQGFKTASFISPHIIDYNERILYEGRKITDEELMLTAEEVKKDTNNFDELSFFEVTFILAWRFFENISVDRVVLEVGLGGRLDATNVINWPKTDVITSVGLDHTRILGSTVSEIAAEKAGIIGRGDRVFVGEMSREAEKEVLSAAEKREALECFTYKDFSENINFKSSDIPETLRKNTAIAEFAVNRSEGLRSFLNPEELKLPGRWDFIDRKVVVDVAHNIPAMKALVSSIKSFDMKVVVLFGVLRDKDAVRMLTVLSEVAESVFVITLDVFADRGCRAEDLVEMAEQSEVECPVVSGGAAEKTMSKALNFAKKRDIPLLVTGSFHTVEKFILWYES